MAKPRPSKEEVTRELIEKMLRAVDDHRLPPQARARAERHLRNLLVIQKRETDPGSGPG